MSMRTRVVCVCIVLAGLVIVYLRFGRQPVIVQKTATLSPAPAAIASIGSTLSLRTSSNEISGAARNEQFQREKRAWDKALSTPIAFYGKVEDERGSPIPNARVELGVNDKGISGTTYAATTDAAGSFSLIGARGLSVSVAVSKDGYYQIKESRGISNFVAPAQSDRRIPTPQNPAIFRLRKKGEAARLVVTHVNIPISPNDTAVEVSLVNGAIVPSGTGDLKIEHWMHNGNVEPAGYHPYDWSYRISAPRGGIVVQQEGMNFMAPEGGYTDSDNISMSKAARPWSSKAARRYFVNLTDGRFARVELTVHADVQNHYVTLASYLNPQPGDRNLEFDPNKALKPSS